MNICENLKSKGAHVTSYYLQQALRHAKNQGLNVSRLFVKEAVVGKGLGRPKIDIKAKAAFGIRRSPNCNLKIVLEEKPMKEFYKLILKGEAPPGIAFLQR